MIRGAVALGPTLRQARLDAGLTLEVLGRSVKLSSPYLSRIERGDAVPPPETVAEIARKVALPDEQIKGLLAGLRFRRECLEIERLGYPPDVAEVAVKLGRLEPAERDRLLLQMQAEL